jgi:hypothetical protein
MAVNAPQFPKVWNFWQDTSRVQRSKRREQQGGEGH